MAVTQRTAGTTVYTSNGGTTLSPTPSSATVIGDTMLLLLGIKPDTATTPTISGWDLIGSTTGGAGSVGADTGPMKLLVYSRIATAAGTADAPGTITIVSNSVTAGKIMSYAPAAGNALDVAYTGAADVTTGTPFTATMPLNPGLTVGDYLLAVGVIPTDITTPAQFSAETVSATGMTTVSLTEIEEWDSGNGNDMGGWLASGPVVTGTASVAPTVSATATGTTTNVMGPIGLVRLREFTPDVVEQKSNSAEGGFAGDDVTVASSGGTSGDAFTIVSTGGSNTVKYANTTPMNGSVYMRNVAPTAASNAAPYWDIGPHDILAQRAYIRLDALPTANAVIMAIHSAGAVAVASLRVSTAGSITMLDANNTAALVSTTNMSAGTIYRFEIVVNVALGLVKWAYYVGHSLTPVEEMSLSSASLGSAKCTRARFGKGGAGTWAGADYDDVSAKTGTYAYIGPSEAPPSVVDVAGSDTGTLSVTEARAIVSTSTSTDTGTLSATEGRSFGTLAVAASDSGTFSATESGSTAINVSATDTGTLSGTDASATIPSTLTRTDTGTVSATETASIYLTASTSDSGTISATEGRTVALAVSASDTGSVSATESTALVSSSTRTDTGTLSATDASIASRIITASDSGTFSTGGGYVYGQGPYGQGTYGVVGADGGETSSLSTGPGGADTGTLSATEGRTLFVTMTRTDTGTVSATDSSMVFQLINILSASDSGTLSATDAGTVTPLISLITASDTGTISATESRQFSTVAVSGTDTGTISTTDAASVSVNVSTTDAGTLSATEGRSVAGTVVATDTGSVSAVENAGVFSDRPGADTGSVIGTETSEVVIGGLVLKSAVDSGTLSATEAKSFGTTAVAASDTGTLSATDTSVKTITYQATSASDTGILSATESRTLSASSTRTDTGTLSATEGRAIALSFTRTDSGTISATQTGVVSLVSPDMVKLWTGAAHVVGVVKVWDGTQMRSVQIHAWDGNVYVA